MHCSEKIFGSRNRFEQIKALSNKIKIRKSKGFSVYEYFNNDFHGFAIENAKEILDLLH
jgi:uncharacterized protein YecE (DUF72 family)